MFNSAIPLSNWGRLLRRLLPVTALALSSLWLQPVAGQITPPVTDTPEQQAAQMAVSTGKEHAAPGPSAALLPDNVAVTIAEYAEGGAGEVRNVLRNLGLTDAVLPAEFQELSSLQQLQWAYASTERAEAGSGKRFLSAFITVAAKSVPSLLDEPLVKKYVAQHPASRRSFVFTKRAAAVPAKAIDPSVRNIITIVADVVSSKGSQISARKILERKLGLKPKEVLSLLMEYGSGRDALVDKLSRLPNPPQKQKLAEIAREIFETIPASRSDKTLAEVIFRWSGLGDATYGEWFRYRDRMIDAAESGAMNLEPKKLEAAKQAAAVIRSDIAEMTKVYANLGHNLTPAVIERMFYEYTARNPEAAALWGYAVIAMKDDFEFDRYIDEAVKSLKKRYYKSVYQDVLMKMTTKMGRTLTEAEKRQLAAQIVAEPLDEAELLKVVREHGPKPHNGYSEYVRITGFADVPRADQYFSSSPVQDAVEKLCPT